MPPEVETIEPETLAGETPKTDETIAGETPKTDETVPPSDDGKETDKPGEKEESGAPEKYEDFTVPEGQEIDSTLIEQFSPLAKEANMSQETAQKFVDFYNKSIAEVMGGDRIQEAVVAAQTQINQDNSAKWGVDLKADKKLGGDNFKQTSVNVGKFMNTFGNQELRDLFNNTGLGNHIEIVRAMNKAASHISEDVFINTGTTGGKQQTDAQILYPNESK